jgi:16S rRNA (uracil1498-N3)-methyltransferase
MSDRPGSHIRAKHRFFVPSDSIQGNVVLFSAEQAHQLRAVLRLRAGDTVRVFDGVARTDRVVTLDAECASGNSNGSQPQAAEPRTRLIAYPALLQRDKFETVLQKLTELGVAAITPVVTERCLVRQPGDERRQVRWQAIMREAAEQCGRGIVPSLAPTLPFDQALAAAAGKVLLAYEGERQRSLKNALSQACTWPALGASEASRVVSLFVGPEGGYSSDEVARARDAGADLITLGARILRAETASPVLAALVLYELGDLLSEAP